MFKIVLLTFELWHKPYNTDLLILSAVATDSIVVGGSFFSLCMVTHEPLHLSWLNFAQTCPLTTARNPDNVTVIDHGDRTAFQIFHQCEIGQKSLWTR